MKLNNKKVLILGMAAGFIIGFITAWILRPSFQTNPTQTTETGVTRETFIDTIPYYHPVPKDSLVVRYETRKLPVSDPEASNIQPGIDMKTDSITVEIPITQKTYADSTYKAWVSGYLPSLDSIQVYPRTEVITITNTISQKERQRRWGLSIGAGATINTKKEIQPGLFVGVSYTFLAF